MRFDDRAENQLRKIKFTRNYTKHAEGSVLVELGDTKVICNASAVTGVPKFLKGGGKGWVTAEYSMLPRSTGDRMSRESVRGKQSGRTQEIQRLIGRTLRAMFDLNKLKENTIHVDCDVIQADGGTRTASICGACVAVSDAVEFMLKKGLITHNPIKYLIAAISVGVVSGSPVLDLNYKEDSSAETDMNVIMNEKLEFIEIQGTAEAEPFSADELSSMLDLAKLGISEIIKAQQLVLSDNI